MRCPGCNLELNPHSERCPRCGTSTRLAKPDGDTMTRVRRQIAIVRGEREVSDEDLSDASFSPVLKFDRPSEPPKSPPIPQNPADNFEDRDFTPVDISDMAENDRDDPLGQNGTGLSGFRRLERSKADDLLAAYYFKDGITDLERQQLQESYAALERAAQETEQEHDNGQPASEPPQEEMSESARRLSQFPEESGLDKVLTSVGEQYDELIRKIKVFFHKLIVVKGGRLYNRFDSWTAPVMDKLLGRFYYVKFRHMRRRREENEEEKKRIRAFVWGSAGILLAVVLCGLLFFASLMTEPLTGDWVISSDVEGRPNIMMSFHPGGSASISVRSDDGWHVHRQGTFSTRRKNGYNLLTIQYEDGTVARLYYEIDGKKGTFTNVETRVITEYQKK